jgi:hypothetical protein
MDSGKSTLVAVLTHGSDGRPLLDNCRGSARMAVFRHKHEIESGRTSSISQQVRVLTTNRQQSTTVAGIAASNLLQHSAVKSERCRTPSGCAPAWILPAQLAAPVDMCASYLCM